jgi:hypothetical protein
MYCLKTGGGDSALCYAGDCDTPCYRNAGGLAFGKRPLFALMPFVPVFTALIIYFP